MMQFLLEKYPDGIFCKTLAGDTPLHLLLTAQYCEQTYLPDGASKISTYSSIHILLGCFLRFAVKHPDFVRLLKSIKNNDDKNIIETARACEFSMGKSFNVLHIVEEVAKENIMPLYSFPFQKRLKTSDDPQPDSEECETAVCSTATPSDRRLDDEIQTTFKENKIKQEYSDRKSNDTMSSEDEQKRSKKKHTGMSTSTKKRPNILNENSVQNITSFSGNSTVSRQTLTGIKRIKLQTEIFSSEQPTVVSRTPDKAACESLLDAETDREEFGERYDSDNESHEESV